MNLGLADRTNFALSKSVNTWGRASQVLLAVASVLLLAPAAADTWIPWLVLGVQVAVGIPIAIVFQRRSAPDLTSDWAAGIGYLLDLTVFMYVLVITGGAQSPLVVFPAIFLFRAALEAYSVLRYALGGAVVAVSLSAIVTVQPGGTHAFGTWEAFLWFQYASAYAIGFFPLRRRLELLAANERLETWDALVRSLSADLDTTRVAATILDGVIAATGASGGFILKVDPPALRVLADRGLLPGARDALDAIETSDPLLGDVLRSRSRLWSDVRDEAWYPLIASALPGQAALSVAISGEGLAPGYLAVIRPVGDPFALEDLVRAEALVAAALPALRNAAAYERARNLNATDDLTRLFNSRQLRADLDAAAHAAVSGSVPLSFIMFDLDRFKEFNDTHGHPAGDEVLRTVGRALAAAVDDGRDERAYRYGGEEFSILLPGTPAVAAGERAHAFHGAVNTALAAEHTRDGRALTISLGVATLPDDGGDARELVKAADGALYRAKAFGRNRVEQAGIIPDIASLDTL